MDSKVCWDRRDMEGGGSWVPRKEAQGHCLPSPQGGVKAKTEELQEVES